MKEKHKTPHEGDAIGMDIQCFSRNKKKHNSDMPETNNTLNIRTCRLQISSSASSCLQNRLSTVANKKHPQDSDSTRPCSKEPLSFNQNQTIHGIHALIKPLQVAQVSGHFNRCFKIVRVQKRQQKPNTDKHPQKLRAKAPGKITEVMVAPVVVTSVLATALAILLVVDMVVVAVVEAAEELGMVAMLVVATVSVAVAVVEAVVEVAMVVVLVVAALSVAVAVVMKMVSVVLSVELLIASMISMPMVVLKLGIVVLLVLLLAIVVFTLVPSRVLVVV